MLRKHIRHFTFYRKRMGGLGYYKREFSSVTSFLAPRKGEVVNSQDILRSRGILTCL